GAGVQALRPLSDPLGPGTRGKQLTGFNGSELANITTRLKFIPSEIPSRVQAMATNHVPLLLGLKPWHNDVSTQGCAWLYWPFAIALVLALARSAWQTRGPTPWQFPVYLIGLGLVAVLMYAIARPSEQMIDRYFLFVLLTPVGVVAWFLAVESRAALRAA